MQSMEIRWDVLTIGHLSRNRYWGEADDRSYREPRCTTTLLRTADHVVVVDPGLRPEQMGQVLDQRAGLAPDAVDIVFLTHFHGDHRYGLSAFPGARWYMAPEEIRYWQAKSGAGTPERELLGELRPAPNELLPSVRVIATPGHTLHHASLLFESDQARVAIAGDAAMTRDFFSHRDFYFNTVDDAAALSSIDLLQRESDIIVPGHDNYFLTRPWRR